jgi:hypothetical protein
MSAPAVAVSPDGKKFAAAWKDLRTGRNDPHVYWSVSDSPNSFEDSPICFEVHAKQDHPTITFDSQGRVWVAWEDTRSGSRQIWARSSADSDSGGIVSDPSHGDASFPAVAANARGVALVYEVVYRGKKSIMFRWLQAPGS